MKRKQYNLLLVLPLSTRFQIKSSHSLWHSGSGRSITQPVTRRHEQGVGSHTTRGSGWAPPRGPRAPGPGSQGPAPRSGKTPLGTDGRNPSEVRGHHDPRCTHPCPATPRCDRPGLRSSLRQGRAGRGAAAKPGRAPQSVRPDSARPRPQRHAWLAQAARSPRLHVHTPAALPFRSVRPTRGRPGFRGVPPLGGSRVGVGGPRPFGGSRAGVGGPRLLGRSRVVSAGLGRSAGLSRSSASGRRLGSCPSPPPPRSSFSRAARPFSLRKRIPPRCVSRA